MVVDAVPLVAVVVLDLVLVRGPGSVVLVLA